MDNWSKNQEIMKNQDSDAWNYEIEILLGHNEAEKIESHYFSIFRNQFILYLPNNGHNYY